MRPPITVVKEQLLAESLELIRNELYLWSDDDLYRVLCRTENTLYSCALDLLLIHIQTIFDLQAQTCDTVINRRDVLRSTYSLKNNSRDIGIVVARKFYRKFGILIILPTWSLEIELLYYEIEYDEVDDGNYKSDRNYKPWINRVRSVEGEKPVNETRGEVESSSHRKNGTYSNGNSRQKSMYDVKSRSKEHE